MKKCICGKEKGKRKRFCSLRCMIEQRTEKNANGCWIWMGKINTSGYGQFVEPDNRKRQITTHRTSYEIYKGIIPDGMCVCHSCDNTKCCNPEHLWLGTPKQNFHDAMKKEKTVYGGAKGEKSGNAKLSDEKVREIRELRKKGVFARILAEKYGVHIQLIFTVQSRKAWKHVK